MDRDNTIHLLDRLRAGDAGARERLVERALPPLYRWSHGRLPQWARGGSQTRDLVHDVIARAMPRLERFSPHGPGELLAFLKRSVRNQVVDEIRRSRRRRVENDIPDTIADPAPSPLELAIRGQGLAQYRSALASLSRLDQTLIVERIERGRSYVELAALVEKPSANAVRVAVARALARLAAAVERSRQ